MADNHITVIGNATREPELRFTANGAQVCNFSVAHNRRWKRKGSDEWDEQVSFFNVTVWGDMAEYVAASVQKGDRVCVSGRLEQRTWETEQNEKRSTIDIVADDVALSLRYAMAQAQRVERSQGRRERPADSAPAEDWNNHDEPF